MSRKKLLGVLRHIAPDWTWRAEDGTCLLNYGSQAHPWGRQVPAWLVVEPTCKVRGISGRYLVGEDAARRRVAHDQFDAARTYLITRPGYAQKAGFLAAVAKEGATT